METHLTIKHLAPYLPYELKGNYEVSEVVPSAKFELRNKELRTDNIDFFLNYAKPILRPLSCLTKEIEVNGEKFSPYDWFEQHEENDYFADNIWIQYLFNYEKDDIIKLDLIPYGVMEKLFEWHFDVFGLIEKGLAISYNDL